MIRSDWEVGGLGLWSETLITKMFKKIAMVFSYRIVCQWPKLMLFSFVTPWLMLILLNILTSISLFFKRLWIESSCIVYAQCLMLWKCWVLLLCCENLESCYYIIKYTLSAMLFYRRSIILWIFILTSCYLNDQTWWFVTIDFPYSWIW